MEEVQGADDGKADFVPQRRTAAGLEAITMSTSTRGARMGVSIATAAASAMGWSIFSQVRAKRDALDLLQKQLASCRKGGMVATGSMSDPYNPLEEKQRLTRGMLTLLLRYSFGVSIATKSSLVERDIDLLEQIKGYAPALVKSSPLPHRMTVWQNSWSRTHPPPPGDCKRWNVCAHRGIFCRRAADAGPSLFWRDNPKDDIRLLVERCAQAGAKFIYPYFGVTLRDRQREYFLSAWKKGDQMFGKNISVG